MFMAKHIGENNYGFAVCNFTSPGINFSELTNSVKFFYSSPGWKGNQALADSLADRINEAYAVTQVKEPVLLLVGDQPVPAGYKKEKEYTLWAGNLLYAKEFRDSAEHIFANLRSFIRKRRAS